MPELTHAPAGGTVDEPGENGKKVTSPFVPKKISFFLLAVCLVVFSGVTLFLLDSSRLLPKPVNPFIPAGPEAQSDYRLEKFSSAEEFKEYLAAGGEATALTPFGSGSISQLRDTGMEALSLAPGAISSPVMNGGAGRVSTTNVQVAGIDEPDILKTDGKNLYYASQSYSVYPAMINDLTMERMVPPQPVAATKIIQAFPPAQLGELAALDQRGELLLSGNNLMIFTLDRIYGYDVTDPAHPQQAWELKYESGRYLEAARLLAGKLYVVVHQTIDSFRPCPSPVFEGVQVECTQIYHPREPQPTDSLYSALVVDPGKGKVEKTVTFTGRSGATVVYMSENNLYVTYPFEPRQGSFYADFLMSAGTDLVPASLTERVRDLVGYEISETSRLTEIGLAIEGYMQTLNENDRLAWENNLENKLEDFFETHKREYEVSGVVRIDLGSLEVKATGFFPGAVLNQFSLDEYQDNLRVATTIGGRWGIGDEEANDVHVLDRQLKIIGSVTQLGITERIYSARFLGDRGYLVTYRQVDPFYVLDLSKPEKPVVAGELKIPGYSAYLHPLSGHVILGIGEQGGKVKVSLFDVSDPGLPSEQAKYVLEDYWSEANTNHHAFLLDADHQVFFLPGSRGGYVFSYAGQELVLKKAVADFQARRAVYLDDYLYLVGETQIVVINEVDWQEVNRFNFEN